MNAILNSLVESVVAEQGQTVNETEKAAATAGTLPSQTVTTGTHSPMETVYQTKYKHLVIVPGSLVQDVTGAHPTYKNKVRVKVVCNAQLGDGPRCTEVVERATSDLHTFLGCETCKKVIRKLNKATKALAEIGRK